MYKKVKFSNAKDLYKELTTSGLISWSKLLNHFFNNLSTYEELITEVAIMRNICNSEIKLRTYNKEGIIYLEVYEDKVGQLLLLNTEDNESDIIKATFTVINEDILIKYINLNNLVNFEYSLLESIIGSYYYEYNEKTVELENAEFLDVYKRLSKDLFKERDIQAGNHLIKFSEYIKPCTNLDYIVDIIFELIKEDEDYLGHLNKIFLHNDKRILKEYIKFNSKEFRNFRVVYSIDKIINLFDLKRKSSSYKIFDKFRDYFNVYMLKDKVRNSYLLIISNGIFDTDSQLYIVDDSVEIDSIKDNLNTFINKGFYIEDKGSNKSSMSEKQKLYKVMEILKKSDITKKFSQDSLIELSNNILNAISK